MSVFRDDYVAELVDALELEDESRDLLTITTYMLMRAMREEKRCGREIDAMIDKRARLELRGEKLSGRDVERLAVVYANFAIWRARRISSERRFAEACDLASLTIAEVHGVIVFDDDEARAA